MTPPSLEHAGSAEDPQGADPEHEADSLLAAGYRASRAELLGYLTHLVARSEVAEEFVQEAALRLLNSANPPTDLAGTRAWLFRVGTNLAIDHLRRHGTWREGVLLEARVSAEQNQPFVAASRMLVGSPETAAIAREHLSVCFSCTLRNLPPQEAATLLLVEVYDFPVQEAADQLGASLGQAKHWLQQGRARLRAKYAQTCALVSKQGVCYQCVELSEFFAGRRDNPLAQTPADLDDRLAIIRERRASPLGPWHQQLMRIVDQMLGHE